MENRRAQQSDAGGPNSPSRTLTQQLKTDSQTQEGQTVRTHRRGRGQHGGQVAPVGPPPPGTRSDNNRQQAARTGGGLWAGSPR